MAKPEATPELVAGPPVAPRPPRESAPVWSKALAEAGVFDARPSGAWAFEDLLLSLCVGFINCPTGSAAEGLDAALRQIGEFTGVDRCFVYLISPDGGHASLAHAWTPPGAPETPATTRRLSMSRFAWEKEKIVRDGFYHVPDATQLDARAEGLRWLYNELGVMSAINLPMMVEGELAGVLGLSCFHQKRSWSAHDIAVAKVLAELLVNVLERSRTDKALRESEARFRGIVLDQTDLIVRWEPDGTQRYVNEAVARLLQTPAEAIVGTSVFDNVHPDDLPAVKRKISGLTIDKPAAVGEHRVVLPDGAIAWQQWVDRALFDEGGRLVEYQSVGRDVTRLKQTQSELEYRLGFEKLLLSLSKRFINLPLERFDEELQDALRRVAEFTGVERSYLYLFNPERNEAHLHTEWFRPGHEPMTESFHRIRLDDFPWARDALYRNEAIHIPTLSALPAAAAAFREQLARIGVKSYINVPMLLGDEVIGHLGCTTFQEEKTWSDDETALLRLLGEVLVNALKRRETQQALADQERRLRLTVEGVEEGLFDWDILTGRVSLSDYLKRSVGLSEQRERWRFDNWAERIHPDDRGRVMANLDAHLEGRLPAYDAEYRFLRYDNVYRWMHSRGRVVEHDPDGRPRRMLGVQRDITSRMRQREAQREQEAQLAHLGRVAAMGETVAGISHEVNQPLHAASAYCSAASNALRVAKPGAAEKAMTLTQQAADQVRRAGEILHRLRDFTRPRPKDVAAIDLHTTIQQSVDFLAQLGASRGIQVETRFAPDEVRVLADRVQLQQVLVNLMQNACDSLNASGDPTPVMEIRTEGAEGVAVITVADNASTPPPEEPEKLFDAFYTTKPDGMGVGLALCRTILTAHGGEIHARPNDDRGMALRFTLPLAPEPASPAATAENKP